MLTEAVRDARPFRLMIVASREDGAAPEPEPMATASAVPGNFGLSEETTLVKGMQLPGAGDEDPAGGSPPPAGSEAAAPSGGQLGPNQMYSNYLNGRAGLMASMDSDHILDLYIVRGEGTSTPSGADMFNEAMAQFSDVRGVRGTWIGGGDIADNFNSYKANLDTMSPQDAAAATFTGKMAIRAGFTNITVVTDTNSIVKVTFTK